MVPIIKDYTRDIQKIAEKNQMFYRPCDKKGREIFFENWIKKTKFVREEAVYKWK
jgi:hypothetical protein